MPSENDLVVLVERARGGDRAALESLLVQLAPAIHRFGMRMCRNAHDADDVLQDTLLSVTTHLGEFEGRSSLSTWAFMLARTACARRRRGVKNRPPVGDDGVVETADQAPDPEARAQAYELTTALDAALQALPEEHREVLVLRDVEGLTAPEAARVLAVSVDAVKSRLHRAREALRTALRPVLEPALPAVSTGCPDAAALWSKKLEGDLSRGDCDEMERHVARCVTCRAACDALKRALLACQRARSAPVPPEVQARVRAAVRGIVGHPLGR